MKCRWLLLTIIMTLAALAWAQTESAPAQAPPAKGDHHHMGADSGKMAEMHKQHMNAMKADVDKMKASLDQLKANVDKISEPTEKARWQANVDLWTVMVGHMEQMMKHMDAMGSEGMMGHGMGHHGGKDTPHSPPPTEPKPQ
jgi:hypothetical protein